MPTRRAQLLQKARRVRVLVTDVDGVLTDARMYYSPQGDFLKAFHTWDGMGIHLLSLAGIPTVIITSETTDIVRKRGEKLKIQNVRLGACNKLKEAQSLSKELNCTLEEMCYVGDDVNDASLLKEVGFAVVVAKAHPTVRPLADWVTRARGGEGAIREVCDLILEARKMDPIRLWEDASSTH